MILFIWLYLIFTATGIILLFYSLSNRNPKREIISNLNSLNPLKNASPFKTTRAFRAYLIGLSLIVIGGVSGSIYWLVQSDWL